MSEPLVVLSGFGPFFQVERNPSGEVALALAASPPPGMRVVAAQLPVTFRHAGDTLEGLIATCGEQRPDAVLALGVHPGPSFRLERRARSRLDSVKPDNEDRQVDGLVLEPDRDLETTLDLRRLAAALERAGAEEVIISEDAGGFVCEATYHRLLALTENLGVPGLFLHVPPSAVVDPARQAVVVAGLLPEFVRQARELARVRTAPGGAEPDAPPS